MLGASAGGTSRYRTDFQVHHASCDGQLHCGREDCNLLLCSSYPTALVDRLSWAWPTDGERQPGSSPPMCADAFVISFIATLGGDAAHRRSPSWEEAPPASSLQP